MQLGQVGHLESVGWGGRLARDACAIEIMSDSHSERCRDQNSLEIVGEGGVITSSEWWGRLEFCGACALDHTTHPCTQRFLWRHSIANQQQPAADNIPPAPTARQRVRSSVCTLRPLRAAAPALCHQWQPRRCSSRSCMRSAAT